jgi:selenophosphate synthase
MLARLNRTAFAASDISSVIALEKLANGVELAKDYERIRKTLNPFADASSAAKRLVYWGSWTRQKKNPCLVSGDLYFLREGVDAVRARANIQAAVASMVALNGPASRLARRFAVHACSDVTGFGLLGHAAEMAMGSGITLVIDATALPLLPGARRLAERGFLTGGCGRNRVYLEDKVVIAGSVPEGLREVAFDPQTSGGLLLALPPKPAGRLVHKLRAHGVEAATILGRACAKRDAWVYLT